MTTEQSRPSTVVKLSTNNGPLAQVWLAANMTNLSRGTVLQTSISESAQEIAKVAGCVLDDGYEQSSLEHITLRTSGELLHGIVRVYSKQAAFLLTDIKDALIKISSLFKSNQRISVTLSKENTIARVDQIILEDAVTERDVLMAPGLEFLLETTLPADLVNHYDEGNFMQRRVTGAAPMAPWDTSIEVGRRFNPDGELEMHHSSTLDLDFDIEGANQISKSWDEGTQHTTSNSTHQGKIPNALGNPDQLIHDDDFPLDDNLDWDLGVTEYGNADVANQAGNDPDRSLEIGRRADASIFEEPTDFGFDLEIGKEPMEDISEQEQQLEELRIEQSRINREAPKVLRQQKNADLFNAKRIKEDTETELDDDIVKHSSSLTVSEIDELSEETDGSENRLNEKRLLDEITQRINYLPTNIVANFVQYQNSKRQKTAQTLLQEPQMNISFGEDDFVAGSGIDSSVVGISDVDNDNEDVDLLPLEADISQPPVEEDSAQEISNLSETTLEKIQLPSGEVVSKTTADMAQLLRTQFIDNDTITFENLLYAKHESDGTSEHALITKKEASRGFFEMLSLATAGCIDLDQQDTFCAIDISTKPILYEKFITA